MDFAALRMLHVDPLSAAFCLTVPVPLLAALLPQIVALRAEEPWTLDTVAVRRGTGQQAEVTLRLASEDAGDSACPRRRQALMTVVMGVLEHLRERWSKLDAPASAAEKDAQASPGEPSAAEHRPG